MSQELVEFIDGLPAAFREGDPACEAKGVEAANVRRVQEMFRSLLRGDLPGFLDGLADDVALEILAPPGFPFAGRWTGREAVAAAVVNNFSRIEGQRPTVRTVAAQGDTVVTVGEERGRVRGAPADYHVHWVQVFTLRDGRVARVREIVAEAVEA
jgi:ketosteroid isomerase-like protein